MFLRPQHFQQQERYFEFVAHARSGAVASHAWGFEWLVLDQDALKLGKLAIKEARGLFPDGTPFSIPAQGDPPATLDIPGEARGQRVLLTLPVRRVGVEDVAFGEVDDGLPRVSVSEREVIDSNMLGATPALVQLGDLRLRLVVESELTDGWMALGVARVVDRRPDNQLLLDDQYMPPHLALRACTPLEAFMRELEGLLHHRGEAVAARMTRPGRGGVAELGDFLLLELVNRWEPSVRHVLQQGLMHSERLYATLLELGGDLADLHARSAAPDRVSGVRPRRSAGLLHAAHRRPAPVAVDGARADAIAIELHERAYGVRVAIMPPVELQRTATFVLAVAADVPADTVRTRFPTQVKIGPVEKIRDLVNLHLPGVTLRPLPVAPRADSVQRGVQLLRARYQERALAPARNLRRARDAHRRRIPRPEARVLGDPGVTSCRKRHPDGPGTIRSKPHPLPDPRSRRPGLRHAARCARARSCLIAGSNPLVAAANPLLEPHPAASRGGAAGRSRADPRVPRARGTGVRDARSRRSACPRRRSSARATACAPRSTRRPRRRPGAARACGRGTACS